MKFYQADSNVIHVCSDHEVQQMVPFFIFEKNAYFTLLHCLKNNHSCYYKINFHFISATHQCKYKSHIFCKSTRVVRKIRGHSSLFSHEFVNLSVLLPLRSIPVFTKYAEGKLHRPQFIVYFNFETGYMSLLLILMNFSYIRVFKTRSLLKPIKTNLFCWKCN